MSAPALLALGSFAIIRPEARLRSRIWIAAALLLVPRAAPAEEDSLRSYGNDATPPDSVAEWLPPEREDLAEPDQLEDSGLRPGLSLRLDRKLGRFIPRRVAAQAIAPRLGLAEAAWLSRPESRAWWTALVRSGSGSLTAALGTIVARPPSVLLGEALGLRRRVRVPLPPRNGPPEFETPRGPSSAGIRGAAFSLGGRALLAWGLTGLDGRAARIDAGGFSARLERSWVSASAGSIRSAVDSGGAPRLRRRLIAAAGHWEQGTATIAGEALFDRSSGPEAMAEVIAGQDPLRLTARWRRGAGEARPVAGELIAEMQCRVARALVRWKSWSARAEGDDGRLELETSWRRPKLGLTRLRVGTRGGGPAFASSQEAARSTERFALVDAVVARDRGRALALLASCRERRGGGRREASWMIGGRLEVSSRGRAGATVLVQATRIAPLSDAAAWTTVLTPAGSEALETRSGSGAAASGRFWLRLGPARLEALAWETKGSAGSRRMEGSLRLEWRAASRSE